MQFQLFFDYEAIVNTCSFTRKYDAIFQAFDKVYDGRNHPAFGRKGYPKSAYLKALVYKQCEQIKHITDLIRDLQSRPAICMLIGFEPGKVPSPSRFSRFLSSMNNSEIEQLTHSAAKLLIEAGHVSTDVLIGDSKPIRGGNKKEQAKLPAECPVAHPRFTEEKRYGCTAYIDLAGDARAQARLRRQSKSFQETYDLRTEVERYFSRLGPREVEDATLYKYSSIRNLMSIAHLSLNLVAVAAAMVFRRPEQIRCYKTFADPLAA